MASSVTDKHTLQVKTYATYEQLVNAINLALDKAKQTHKELVNSDYVSSIVCIPNGFHFGYGYIHFSDSQLYYMFLGKNPDGTERLDMTWVEPAAPKPEILTEGKSWADIVEEEESMDEKYKRPYLPPMITLEAFPYSEEQREKIKSYLVKSNKPLPPNINFTLSPAEASPIEENKHGNILYIPDIPTWITEKDLLSKFKRFSASGNYPKVVISPARVGFITFNPTTREASFARMLTRKLLIKKDSKVHTLVVDYSQKKKH